MKIFRLFPIILLALAATLPLNGQAGGMDEVTIETRSGPQSWQIELASDDASRSKGLMFRETMAPRSGMLFRFEATRLVSMWMKNTAISLDMIFANAAGQVTHIHRGAVPHSLDIISSNGPVRFVLEVNAGEADHYGIAVGDRLSHPWILPAN